MSEEHRAYYPNPSRMWNALGCLALLGILLVTFFPVWARSRASRFPSHNNCLSNVRQITLGMSMYAADNGDHLPFASDWPQSTLPFTKNQQMYTCPSDAGNGVQAGGDLRSSYAMNECANALSLAAAVDPAQMVVVFDGTAIFGRLAAAAFRHAEGLNVASLDSHAKWLSKDDFTLDRLCPPGLKVTPVGVMTRRPPVDHPPRP